MLEFCQATNAFCADNCLHFDLHQQALCGTRYPCDAQQGAQVKIGRQMDRVIGLRDGRIVENILHDYYGLSADAPTLEMAERLEVPALEPVEVRVRGEEQDER